MSMVTELWGTKALKWSKEKIKSEIRKLPETWSERKSYILHDFSRLTGVKMEHRDYTDVGCYPQTK